MKTYFAYTRVSTVRQGERGSSLQEQKSAIEAYAARHGLTITAWFEEMETAAKLGRRMFNRMLADLSNGEVAGVVIHKIDRSARNLKDWAHLGELIDRGVEVHFAHESLDLASRGGRLSADIQAVVAADFIRNLKQEVRKGFYGRLKQGLYPLPAPAGYLDRGKGKVKEIDPERGPLVRQAFELCGTGRFTLETLRLEMHRRGLRGRTGKAFSKNGMAWLLHNPFYMGLIRIKRTAETFQGEHTPLITKVAYDRAQAVLSGRAQRGAGRHDYVFRRLIRCQACDRALTAELQKGHVYYRCHTQTCRGVSLRENDINEEVRTVLALLKFTEEELQDLRDLGDDSRATAAVQALERKSALRLAIGQSDDRRTRLTDAYLDGAIDKEVFEHRKTALLTERRGLQDALEAPDEELGTAAMLEKFELANTAYLRFDSPITEEKRETVILVSSNLLADGKNVAISLRFPFDQIAKWRILHNGGPQHDRLRTGGTSCAEPVDRDALEMLVKSLKSQSPQDDLPIAA